MANEKNNRQLVVFGAPNGGGGGNATWGSITGVIDNQTDLMGKLAEKADTSSLATVATSGDYTDLTNKPTIPDAVSGVNDGTSWTSLTIGSTTKAIPAAQVNSDWNSSSGVSQILNKPSLATVATSGNYSDLTGTPTIPTVNDATITLQDGGGTTIDSFTLNQSSDKTITIPSGANQWFGTQSQFDNLGTYDDNTDYYISDKLDYNTDLKNKPDLSSYATKSEVAVKNAEQDTEIAGKLGGHFMTQQEFDALGNNVPEGENYFIEGSTVEMVVTFTDQSTATYNVVVD